MSQVNTIAEAGGFAGGAVLKLLSELLGDFIDATGDLIRTEVAIDLKFIYNWTAEAFDGLVEGTPDSTIGMAPSGMLDVLERMIRVTAQVGLAIGTEVAEELFMEMIQEGFSNAIQTAMGGSLQTMLNVWRGGMPPNPDELDTLIGKVADIDEDTLALLIAMSGSNIPTTFYRVTRGFDMYVDEEIRLVREQLIDVLNKLNQVITWLYEISRHLAINELEESLAVIKEAYSKGINLLDEVGERALSRLQELKVECETAKAWYEYSQAYPETPLITDTELSYVAIENEEEADATFNTYQSIKSTIENTLANVDVQIETIVSKINSIIAMYVEHLNKIIETGSVSFSTELEKIRNALQKVIAYRNAVDTSTKIESPIEAVTKDTTLVAPNRSEDEIALEYEYQLPTLKTMELGVDLEYSYVYVKVKVYEPLNPLLSTGNTYMM